MLKLTDLTLRPDVQLGPMLVSPSRRLVEGPGGFAHLEPLIMQVFLLLLDARGKVVTRNELFDQVWGGVYVGDDSLNRTIGKIRRTGAQVAPGLFEIETIPRTGYRLTGEILEHIGGGPAEAARAAEPSGISRRVLVGSGVAAAAIFGAVGLWWANRPRTDPRFLALMNQADEAVRNGSFENPKLIGVYEQAVRLEPGSARAWGLLALYKSREVDHTRAENPARTLREAEEAARRALAIDAKEPNALTAMVHIRGPLDWASRDRQFRSIVAIDRANIPALTELMTLLQAAGMNRESWSWNERILEVAPLSRPHLVMRAMKLWILGNVPASDKAFERVRALWPADQFAFGQRLGIFIYTGRPSAALAMLENAPAGIDVQDFSLSRIAAEALQKRTPSAMEAARNACVEAARKTPWKVNSAAMILGSLGEPDLAFELTEGYLLSRGKVVSGNQSTAAAISDWNRRMTPWLFTPPLAAMRADPRFLKLCEATGLGAYWRARGVKPDYLAYKS